MAYFNHALERAYKKLKAKDDEDFKSKLDFLYHGSRNKDAASYLQVTARTLQSWIRRFGIKEKDGKKVFAYKK